MQIRSSYTLKQINTIDNRALVNVDALGNYCYVNSNNYSDPNIVINDITISHEINNEVIFLVFSLQNSIIFVNKNNYYLVYGGYTKKSTTILPPLFYSWLVFSNIEFSSIIAKSEETLIHDPPDITGQIWKTGLKLNKGPYFLAYDVQTFPTYTRPWVRWSPPCIRCNTSGEMCTKTPSQFDLDMRRKAEVLLYKKNAMPSPKKLTWNSAVKQSLNRKGKKTFGTQSTIYTDPNVQKYTRVGNKLIINPPGFEVPTTFDGEVKDKIISKYCIQVDDNTIRAILPNKYRQPSYITTLQKVYFFL